MTWYKTGTVTVTNGSTTVTGAGGADFITANVAKSGYAFIGPDGKVYEVSSVTDSTNFELASGYLGSNQSGAAYAILPTQGVTADLLAQVNALITTFNTIANEAGAGKFGDGTAAAPGIAFNSDQDSGLYRVGTNHYALVSGGQVIAEISATGFKLVGKLDGDTITYSSKDLVIAADTVDGTDDASITLSAGGVIPTQYRGPVLKMSGNEHANAGEVELLAGVNKPIYLSRQIKIGGDKEIANGSDIRMSVDTQDGSDTAKITKSAGGASANYRAAYYNMYGEDHATQPGDFEIFSGLSGKVKINGNAEFSADIESVRDIIASRTIKIDGTGGGTSYALRNDADHGLDIRTVGSTADFNFTPYNAGVADFTSEFKFLSGTGWTCESVFNLGNDVLPLTTNSHDVGSATLAMNDGYFQNAITVTSDGDYKNLRDDDGVLSAEEIRAYLACGRLTKIWKWKDQQAAGETETITPKVQLTKKEEVTVKAIEIVDGKAVEKFVTQTMDVEQFEEYPVYEEDAVTLKIEVVAVGYDKETKKPILETITAAPHRVPIMVDGEPYEKVITPAINETYSRLHTGPIVQDCMAAFTAEGLNPSDYAWFRLADKDDPDSKKMLVISELQNGIILAQGLAIDALADRLDTLEGS